MPGPVWNDESWTVRRFDTDSRSPTIAIIETVSETTEITPNDLPPLANYTDPDALEQVLDTTSEVTIHFEYGEIDVLIVGSHEYFTVRCNP